MDKLKIVVVDDEPAARTNAAELLRKMPDCELVGMAENGAQALEMAAALKPHVMLVDVSMPGMTGLQLVRTLRQEHPEVQVIMLTMYSDFDYAVNAFREGAVDYILKDAYDVKPLMQALEKARRSCIRNSEKDAAAFAYALEKQRRERAWLGESGRFLCFTAISESLSTLSGQYAALDGCFERCIPVDDGVWFGAGTSDEPRLPKGVVSFGFVSGATDADLKRFLTAAREVFYFPMTGSLSGAAYVSGFPGEVRNQLRRRFAEFMNNGVGDFPGDYVAECIERRIPPETMKELLVACLRDMDQTQRTFHEVIEQIQQAGSAQAVVLALRTAQLQWRLNAQRREHMLITKLKRYIAEHLAEDLSLNVLAEQVGFSSAYVSALFKSETGGGLKHYIIQARLERAAELLKTTNMKIYEIADQCGFANTRYFSDLFTKTYNMTPQKYRRWG